MTVTHSAVVVVPDDGTSPVGTDEWNADHVISGTSLNIQYNAAGVLTGMAGTSWDNTNRSLTLTGATVTTSKPIFDLSQTWNDGAVTFTGLKFNVTNTASAAGSLLIDFQVGGGTQFSVRKDGSIVFGYCGFANAAGTLYVLRNDLATFAQLVVGPIKVNNDVNLSSDGSNILTISSFGTAQTFRVYNTTDGGSNYERGVFDWTTTANILTIGTQAAGTGTVRTVALIRGAGGQQVQLYTNGQNYYDADGHNFRSTGVGTLFGIDINANITCGAGAISTSATDGFLYIATCAGTPTGTPTAKTGRIPMVYDTTNHQFWFYDGGWKQPKTPAGAATVTWQ